MVHSLSGDDDGYTLLELLVATILGTFLLVTITGALHYTGHIRARIDRSEALAGDASAARRIVIRILEGAQPFPRGMTYADRTVAFLGSADTIQLVGRLPEAIAVDQSAQEQLAVAGDGPSRGLWFYWTLGLPPAQAGYASPPRRVELLAGVDSIRFSFFGSVGSSGHPAWHDTWAPTTTLPSLVKVNISRLDLGTGTPRPISFVVDLPIFATPACRFNPEDRACRRVQ